MQTKPPKRYCDKPDRHVPGLQCGYPRPCPWHTAVLEVNSGKVEIKWPKVDVLTEAERDRVIDLAAALQESVQELGGLT